MSSNSNTPSPRRIDEDLLSAAWQQFQALFPTEQHCTAELQRKLTHAGWRCRSCGSQEFVDNRGSRKLRCTACKNETSLTAGTFFHNIRNVRAWLGAIWLMEHGILINSFRFHKLVGIAYSSAFAILKKLSVVVEGQMDDNNSLVPSFAFKSVFYRRSRETPAREHPAAEESAIGQDSASSHGDPEQSQTLSSPVAPEIPIPVPTIQLNETDEALYDLLSAKPIHFDELCRITKLAPNNLASTLMLMELDGLVERVPGDRYVRIRRNGPSPTHHAPPDEAAIAESLKGPVNTIRQLIQKQFQGISRKYVQLYLAAIWCHLDRATWDHDSLMKACLRFGPVPCRAIVNYVSPASVKFFQSTIGVPSSASR